MASFSSPAIHAVVEVAIREECVWSAPPERPWPEFVRLWHATSGAHVSLVVGTLSSYGAEAKSSEQLVEEFPDVLPGGLAVVTSDVEIMPSCCCGLEHWREWEQVLATGQSPWTGHDPAPLVERTRDGVLVWSDGGMGPKPSERPIAFTTEEFSKALRDATNDLHEFLHPLQQWLEVHTPEQASKIVDLFKGTFLG